MIHYHGGPISPIECAYATWRGRHAFISFAHPEQVAIAAECAQSFAIDNGAYSFWKAGKSTDWDAYYLFVEEWMRHPSFDWAVIPDVIEGSEAENDELIATWPFGLNGVPVWHLHESIERLRGLCSKWPRVSLGSSGEYAELETPAWWERMAEAMESICDERGRPCCKLHGLRMLDPEVFSRFPLASADAAYVAQKIGFDCKWKDVYRAAPKRVRALAAVDEIEAHQSAAAWTRQMRQMELTA